MVWAKTFCVGIGTLLAREFSDKECGSSSCISGGRMDDDDSAIGDSYTGGTTGWWHRWWHQM